MIECSIGGPLSVPTYGDDHYNGEHDKVDQRKKGGEGRV